MNTILIIIVVVIIFLLCISNCKHVSGFKDQNKEFGKTDDKCCCMLGLFDTFLPSSVCAKNGGMCGPDPVCYQQPPDLCNAIGQRENKNKWTPEKLKEAKYSCSIYNSVCGRRSTEWMGRPILMSGKTPDEETVAFENATKSVINGGDCIRQP